MTVTDPTTRQRRILALDVARGIAILGTFAANVWIFTDPAGIVGYLASVGTDPWPQRILMQLTQGKFLGLLTLMFGIGLAVQAASAQRAGRPWPGGYRDAPPCSSSTGSCTTCSSPSSTSSWDMH